MRIVILGGGGNVGFWVEKKFLDEKHEVLSVRRGNLTNKRRVHENVELLTILNADANLSNNYLKQQIKNSDLVIDFVCFNRTNAKVRKVLLHQFTGLYLMISTVAVYDRVETLNILTASSACTSLKWNYARNKHEAEDFIIKNLKACTKKILRLGHTYDTALPVPFGPSDWTIPEWLIKGNPLLMHRQGETIWPLLHSKDVASRIYFVANTPTKFSDVLNIVANTNTSWSEIASAFFHTLEIDESFGYLPISTLQDSYPYWSDSVFFHKRFDEKYEGEEQDIFRELFPYNLDIKTGLSIALEWYFSNTLFRNIDINAFPILKSLQELSVPYSPYEGK